MNSRCSSRWTPCSSVSPMNRSIDEGLKLPFSSRHFRECLDLGAEKFGWSQRTPAVGSMKRRA